MIADAHAHVFPTPEAGREWQRMVGVAEPRRAGDLAELVHSMEAAGIERTVMLLYARSGERHAELRAEGRHSEAAITAMVKREIRELNRWGCAAAEADERLIPFVGLNARYLSADELTAELDELVALGARGVKIIPPSMRLYADDPLLWPIYQRCWELGLPILSQSGDGGGPPASPGADHYGRPSHWAPVLREFPGLKLILAHLGHGYEADVVALAAEFDGVHSDTSLRLSRLGKPGFLTRDGLVDLIRRIGADRVLFGTNYPFVSPERYRDTLLALPLADDELELIAGANLERILS
jgi:predicted TIM-barrel fold metal-dependent hydrolase